MPTYEYRCRNCGEPLEVVQSFTDDPLTECPACGGQLRKLFPAVGIAFKGSGFYKTDSRTAAKSSSGSASESSSSSDSKSKRAGSNGDGASSGDGAKPSSSSPSSSPSSSSSSSSTAAAGSA
ncbi:MAG TPA: FmdB family zinc ribbon protein [Acidimicrobiales bacterium]|jgi:putative FmdB family regulatory protein|nr:FmdB family zinc ribbon protein [Acidimicrobiales bacterium]